MKYHFLHFWERFDGILMVSKPKKFGIILSEKVLQLASFTTRFFKNLKLAFQSQLLPQLQGLGKNHITYSWIFTSCCFCWPSFIKYITAKIYLNIFNNFRNPVGTRCRHSTLVVIWTIIYTYNKLYLSLLW